jgi:hypothetical protein
MRRNPQEGERKQKEKTSLQERRRKTSLTLTGLLMEGVRSRTKTDWSRRIKFKLSIH